MDTLNAVIFYILSAICLISGLFCLFHKCTFNAVISASLLLWAVSGLYFLLGASFLAGIQMLLWGVGITIIMMFSIIMTNKDDKDGFLFNLKTLSVPLIGGIFIFLILPFILYQFSGLVNLQSYSAGDFSTLLYKNNAFSFELAGVLVFCVLIGIITILTAKRIMKCRMK